MTFTANVAPQFSGTPTGRVTFYDGTTKLKTVTIGGEAAITTSKLTMGTHNIMATCTGSVDFTGSSASLTQTVNQQTESIASQLRALTRFEFSAERLQEMQN